jgi:beta-phosphoglucomutase-like phosphatase (HAD superfamily)
MAFPHPIRAVVFDMDGLLVDTEVMIRDLMIKAALARGADLPFEVFMRMVGLPDEASNAVARAHFGDDFPLAGPACRGVGRREGRVRARRRAEGGCDRAARPPRCGEDSARHRTSSSHGAVQRTLGPSGIIPRFDAIVAAGDYPRGKPKPDPFLTAAARLGVPPENCLALEDSHNGVRAAHAAGMMTVMVPDLLEATDEMREKCHAIAESLHHVRDMIDARATAGA